MAVSEIRNRVGQRSIDLIVCSSAPRWNTGIRVAVWDSLRTRPDEMIRLVEVDDLAQVTELLSTGRSAVVALEVGEENLRTCVTWLSDGQNEGSPVIGLLSAPSMPIDCFSREEYLRRIACLGALVREAGAIWTLDSPLQSRELLQIARHHCCTPVPSCLGTGELANEIWRLLPWQKTHSPLRLSEEK